MKKRLFGRLAPLAGLVLFCLAVIVYDRFFAAETGFSAVRGGFCAGMAAAGLFVLGQRLPQLRDPERRKRAEIAEQDERRIAICAKAGMPVVRYLSIGMVMAAIIASYVDMTVCNTLIAAAVVQLLIGCGLKLYYTKTM